jgi:hypothetical protein
VTRKVSPGDHLITTAPSLTKCRYCKAPVLAVTVGGLDFHVDTATLNEMGELAALVSGRRTFAYVAQDYLARRTVMHISAGPAERPVLAEHACGPTPDAYIDPLWSQVAVALTSALLGATVIGDLSSEPPY